MRKELSLREVAMEQLQRVNKLRGYPDNRLAIDDYCAALMVAGTFEGIVRTMDEIVAAADSFCPAAAVVRRLAYDQAEKPEFSGCPRCDGTGWRRIERGIYSGVLECECKRAVHV